MSLLAVRDVSKRFGGVNALAGVSFAVDKGDLLSCPECGSNLEVTGLAPLELDLASDEDDDDDEEVEDDDKVGDDDDVDEDEDTEEEEDWDE